MLSKHLRRFLGHARSSGDVQPVDEFKLSTRFWLDYLRLGRRLVGRIARLFDALTDSPVDSKPMRCPLAG